LRYFMAWLKMDVLNDDNYNNYEKLLHKDPKLITSDIIDFIISCLSKFAYRSITSLLRHE
jgi:hypothetical protein